MIKCYQPETVDKYTPAGKYAKENSMAKQMEMETNTMKNWNNIKGDMRLCARYHENSKGEHFVTYSVSIGKKNETGEYDNVYFDVYFRKDKQPEKTDKTVNKKYYARFVEGNEKYTNINIVVYSGFITVKPYRDGVARPAIMIMDYDVLPDNVKTASDTATEAPENCPF